MKTRPAVVPSLRTRGPAAFSPLRRFPPSAKAFHETILDEILEERVVLSRQRINPRGVKRKMSNYPLRPRKRQRTRRVDFAKKIRIVK